MKIPTILKGDDAGAITLSLDSSHNYTNAVLAVAYQGVVKTFAGLSAGGAVSLVYTHAETAGFRLGCYPIEARLIGAGGSIETVSNAEWRIKVTDIVSEVNCGGSFAVVPGAASVPVTDVEEIGERYKLTDLAAKINEVCRILAQRTAPVSGPSAGPFGAVALVLLFSLGAFAANVQTARLDDMYNDERVVTNVTFEGLATPGAVSNIVTKAYVEDLGITADFSTNNVALVETIEATAPAPGNYATVSNRAMTALQSFTEVDPTVPAWAKSPSKPSYSAAEVGAVSLNGGMMNLNATLSFGVAGNGLDINSDGVEISDRDDGRTESLYIDYNSITYTSPNGNEQTLTFPLEASDFDAYTRGEVNAISATIPNNITRTATDATLVHCDSGNCTNELVLIRQASTSLAGLMTAADKTKLNRIDPSLYALKNGSSDLTISKSNPTITLRPASGILGGSSTVYGNGSITSGIAGNEATLYFPETGGTLATTDDIPTDEIANLAEAVNEVSNDNVATHAIVTTWENFLDGSNVVFSITNYISGAYTLDTAKLKILELKDGAYQEVYNSRDEILLHIQDFKDNDFKNATNQVIGAVNAAIENKADRNWGKYTSAGGEAPENTVYMTAPNTVFAGGLEYERVAVGEGTICVLTTRGAPVWTQGDEGTFKFQDDGSTNYFGFAKTDSYTIGANTDGITVQGGMVTMNYNITMSGRPCVWYKSSLSSKAWEQLNLPDGSPVAGASHAVTWEANPDPGTQVCYINVGNAPSGFFKATVEVTGEAKFMTNMPADLSGGVICPNTATGVSGVIKPTFDGTSVIWTWSAK